MNDPCLICGRSAWTASEVVFFTVRNLVPILVDPDEREAIAGVRCVCTGCATFLGACAAQAPPEDIPG
jgi:hypothetical protein